MTVKQWTRDKSKKYLFKVVEYEAKHSFIVGSGQRTKTTVAPAGLDKRYSRPTEGLAIGFCLLYSEFARQAHATGQAPVCRGATGSRKVRQLTLWLPELWFLALAV